MGIWQDIQFAARLLVKDRWFTLVAVLALSLGIGVNATVFTFVNAVLIRGLPFEDPERIMSISSRDVARDRQMNISYPDFIDFTTMAKSFVGLAAMRGSTMNVSDEGRPPERYIGNYVSANLFSLLGQSPVIGRNFLSGDDRPGAAPVVLISGGVWRNRYGSDPNIVGRVVRVNEIPSTIVGVMPEGFRFPAESDVWQPLSVLKDVPTQRRSQRQWDVVARLAPGVSREQAQAEMRTITQNLAAQYPETNKDIEARLMTFNERMNGGEIRAVFLSLMGAVGFVLLIACANVANLLLSRAATRAREISVRLSLGASRRRIVRQLLIESLLVALIAGALGMLLATIGIRLFDAATQDVGKPYWIQFTVDARVVGFFALVCLGTALAFGLAPALHVARTDVNDVLKEGGRSGSAGARVRRWSSALVVAELAMTLALLAGAGFMIRNFLTLYTIETGIDTTKLLTMSLVLPDAKYPSIEQRFAFYDQLQQRLDSRFQNVSVATNMPLRGGIPRQLQVIGRPPADGVSPPQVTMVAVDTRYFNTIGVGLLRGRDFNVVDGSGGQDNAIINEHFAQLHFPNEDPIGRQIELILDTAGGDPPPGIPLRQTMTIVGIAPTIRQASFDDVLPDPVAYVPFRSYPRGQMVLLARSETDPHQLTPVLREELRALDPDLPLFNIRTLDEHLARDRWPFRVFGTMFAIFAFIALVLSAVGLYAVTAYSVTQRTAEIGIRTALGAQANEVMWMFVRRAFVHMGIGLTLGMLGAFGVGALFEATELLIRINGRDPVTIGSIAVLLGSVSLIASIIPARRATQLDPVIALRRD